MKIITQILIIFETIELIIDKQKMTWFLKNTIIQIFDDIVQLCKILKFQVQKHVI